MSGTGDLENAGPPRRLRLSELRTAGDVLKDQLKDPQFRVEWERTAADREVPVYVKITGYLEVDEYHVHPFTGAPDMSLIKTDIETNGVNLDDLEDLKIERDDRSADRR